MPCAPVCAIKARCPVPSPYAPGYDGTFWLQRNQCCCRARPDVGILRQHPSRAKNIGGVRYVAPRYVAFGARIWPLASWPLKTAHQAPGCPPGSFRKRTGAKGSCWRGLLQCWRHHAQGHIQSSSAVNASGRTRIILFSTLWACNQSNL